MASVAAFRGDALGVPVSRLGRAPPWLYSAIGSPAPGAVLKRVTESLCDHRRQSGILFGVAYEDGISPYRRTLATVRLKAAAKSKVLFN
jgi:hypothetical protein